MKGVGISDNFLGTSDVTNRGCLGSGRLRSDARPTGRPGTSRTRRTGAAVGVAPHSAARGAVGLLAVIERISCKAHRTSTKSRKTPIVT